MTQIVKVSDPELYGLANLYDAPAYVKQASDDQVQGHDQVPRHCFADPIRRQFPVHTAAATWLSTASYLTKSAELCRDEATAIAKCLEKHARYWAIQGDIETLTTQVKTAARDLMESLPDEDFGFIERFVDRVERRLPLRNEIEIKVAAQWLTRHRASFAFEDRQRIAERILTKVAQLGIDLGADGEPVEKMAGFGMCAPKVAAELIRHRASIAARSDVKLADGLRMTADEFDAMPAAMCKRAMLLRLANTLETADRHLGLHYGPDLVPPEDVLFAVTEKVANDMRTNHVETPTGTVYKLAELVQIPLADVRDHMGDDFAGAVTTNEVLVDPEKLAAILPSLVRADAQAFDRMAAEMRLAPVMKIAAAYTPLDLAELAQA